MQRTVEIKHVGPREHVQQLLEELSDRLEEKLGHFAPEAVSLHAVFEENGSHKLYRASLVCHVPGHMVAAHEEGRAAGACIRRAFAELARQLERRKATVRHERLVRRTKRVRRAVKGSARVLGALLALALTGPGMARAEDLSTQAPSPRAVEAMQLIESNDRYQQQMGFLRLEALREPATVHTIRSYADHKEPELRGYSLRALAAIQGVEAIPFLVERLATEKSPTVRRAALLGLEPLRPLSADVDLVPLFIKSLRDRKPMVRMTAVDIVSRIDDPRARQAILTRHKREHDRDVRRVLALAMKRLGT